jgi:hypothetical protein
MADGARPARPLARRQEALHPSMAQPKRGLVGGSNNSRRRPQPPCACHRQGSSFEFLSGSLGTRLGDADRVHQHLLGRTAPHRRGCWTPPARSRHAPKRPFPRSCDCSVGRGRRARLEAVGPWSGPPSADSADRRLGLVALGEEDQHGLDSPIEVRLVRQQEL